LLAPTQLLSLVNMIMSHHSNNKHTDGSSTLITFLAGAATATAIGGYFLYGPQGRENREKVSRWMSRAKREILTKMETLEDLTEEKYYTIVDEITERYANMKHIGKEKAAEAAASFKESWEDMRDMVAEAREEAEREVAEHERETKELGSQRPRVPIV